MKHVIPALCSMLLAMSTVSSPAQLAWFSTGSTDDSPSFLGVYLQDVTPEKAQELSMKREQGAICSEITSTSLE